MNRAASLILLLMSLAAPAAFGQLSGTPRPAFDPVPLSLTATAPAFTNPAGHAFDELTSIVRLGPVVRSVSGPYRRPYDPEDAQAYALGAAVVNVLGNKGTFHGAASYVYEKRQRVFAALRMDPYGGDGFTATDTTSGDFRYMGPRMDMEYAYEPMTDLAVGFLVSYEVLDGLKNVYTRSHTTYRDIDYGFGVQYRLGQGNWLGAVVRGIDQQEKIESKSGDDLMDVEIYSYRGDTYATKRRSSSVKQKYRIKGWEAQAEARIDLLPELTAVGSGTYRMAGLWSMFPSGLTQEFEDGYGQQEGVGGRIGVEARVIPDVVLSGAVDGTKLVSWSRVSARSLLMWEWDYYHVDVTVGAVADVAPEIRVRGDGWLRTGAVDSMKYIDSRRFTRDISGSGGSLGVAYRIDEDWRVGISGWMSAVDLDVVVGGTDAAHGGLEASAGWRVMPNLDLELRVGWEVSSGNLGGRTLDRTGQVYSLVIQIPRD